MTKQTALQQALFARFAEQITVCNEAIDMVTIEVSPEHLVEVATVLRDEKPFSFAQLSDVCGVDYSAYGHAEWRTHVATETGFSRAQSSQPVQEKTWEKPRFASVIHLLSLQHNQRLRVRTFADESNMAVPSVVDIWSSANWFERESFDLFGIHYMGHPDLRRILTDYGFLGHPFRKDFPLIGKVELRYDAATERCVYEPVSIQPRTLVPRVIRDDNRYLEPEQPQGDA